MNDELKKLSKWIEKSKGYIDKEDVKVIMDLDSDWLAEVTAYGLIPAVTNGLGLTSTCVNIGKKVTSGMNLDDPTPKAIAFRRFKIGWHLMYVLIEQCIIDKSVSERKKRKKHYDPNIFEVIDNAFVDNLIFGLDVKADVVPYYKRLSNTKPVDFKNGFGEDGLTIINRSTSKALKSINELYTPTVLRAVNKHHGILYRINREVLDIAVACSGDDILTHNKGRKAILKAKGVKKADSYAVGKRRADRFVIDFAIEQGDVPYYEHNQLGFRGRLYATPDYLQHAGGKLAKSLTMLNSKERIGKAGYFWLLVHAANCYGFDKASVEERYEFAKKRLPLWMEMAENPINNKLWQNEDVVDSPWEFLSAILEIKNATNSDGSVNYDYESGLIIAFDASCSGLQFLTALSRDDKTAPYCNLSGSKRGDYYNYIATHVWKNCNYSRKEELAYMRIMDDMSKLEGDALFAYKVAHRKNIEAVAKVFWGKRAEFKRAICKRPCMTYFYSCEAQTMADSMLDDFTPKEAFEGINSIFCFWLTRIIYKTCQVKMPGPTALMKLFVELGIKDYKNDKHFTLNVPTTNFPLVQEYYAKVTEQCGVRYKGERFQPRVNIGSKDKINYKKVKSGTAPNVVHAIDAMFLQNVIARTDYDVVCIHDSFGASCANAGKLYEDVRTIFRDIFSADILQEILDSKGYEGKVKYGSWTSEGVIDQEWFCS